MPGVKEKDDSLNRHVLDPMNVFDSTLPSGVLNEESQALEVASESVAGAQTAQLLDVYSRALARLDSLEKAEGFRRVSWNLLRALLDERRGMDRIGLVTNAFRTVYLRAVVTCADTALLAFADVRVDADLGQGGVLSEESRRALALSDRASGECARRAG